MGKLWIGTSGWSYRDWVGPFYPQGMPSTRWFSHYCLHFRTVELNVTFYRIPTPKTVRLWRDASPGNFFFAIKMNRQITHIRRLVQTEGALARFNEMARNFGPKLNIILIQLPPTLAYEAGLVKDFLDLLRQQDPEHRYALEFRHPSWFKEEVYELLYRKGIACTIADTGGHFPPHEIFTTPYIYMRFHGPTELYASKYGERELAAAADKIQEWLQHRDVYVYFNNDMHGFGVENAFRLREMLNPRLAGQSA